MLWVCVLIKQYLYRYSLPNLYITPCSIFGREKREYSTCASHYAIYFSSENLSRICINLYCYLLSGSYLFKLGFLIVCNYPDIIKRNNCHQWLASFNLVSGLNRFFCNVAI